MPTAKDIYESAVSGLSPMERLRLAALILDELAQSAGAGAYAPDWSEEDRCDLTALSLRHAAQAYPEDDDDT